MLFKKQFLFVFLLASLLLVAPFKAIADDCPVEDSDFKPFKNYKGICNVNIKKFDFNFKQFFGSKRFCSPISLPFNLPDGWVTAHINLDEDGMYTRILNFKDITHECRYSVKNERDYQAWCLDQNLIGDADYDYLVRMFSPFEPLPDLGTFDTPKGEVSLVDFLKKDYNDDEIPYDKILYIINNRDGYSKAEVQEAIWYYTMGDGNFEPETDRYMELVDAAEAFGEGYFPPCDGKLFIFAITKAAEQTPELQPCDLGQPFIIEMPVPRWMCYGFHTMKSKHYKWEKWKKWKKKWKDDDDDDDDDDD